MRDEGLELAIKAAGGISALARMIGVAQPSVSNWSKIPAERVLSVEALTAVERHVLRPDLYPQAGEAGERDPVDVARGRIYLLLGNLLSNPPLAMTLAELTRLQARGDGEVTAALAGLSLAAGETDAAAAGREHFTLFVGVGRAELVPYASYYRTGFLYERPLVNVREDLKVLGVARAEGSDPEDGAGFLCEVMAGMAMGRFPAPESFERRFFMRHLDSWAEKFFSDLEKAEAARFYAAVGRLGRVFMSVERAGFALDAGATLYGADARDTDASESGHERQAS